MSIITFTDRHPAFHYQGLDWSAGVYSSPGQDGTIHVTNEINAEVLFTFPVHATRFEFWGMKRSSGGRYMICVDCTSAFDPATSVPIDAFDALDNGHNPPSLLYSLTFATAGIHNVTLRNVEDPRGVIPPGNSQLALARFVLTLPSSPPSFIRSLLQPTSTSTNIKSTSLAPKSIESTQASTESSSTAASAILTGILSSTTSLEINTTFSAFTPASSVSTVSSLISSLLPRPSESPSSFPRQAASQTTRAIAVTVGSSAALITVIILCICWMQRRQKRSLAHRASTRPYYSRWGASGVAGMENRTGVSKMTNINLSWIPFSKRTVMTQVTPTNGLSTGKMIASGRNGRGRSQPVIEFPPHYGDVFPGASRA